MDLLIEAQVLAGMGRTSRAHGPQGFPMAEHVAAGGNERGFLNRNASAGNVFNDRLMRAAGPGAQDGQAGAEGFCGRVAKALAPAAGDEEVGGLIGLQRVTLAKQENVRLPISNLRFERRTIRAVADEDEPRARVGLRNFDAGFDEPIWLLLLVESTDEQGDGVVIAQSQCATGRRAGRGRRHRPLLDGDAMRDAMNTRGVHARIMNQPVPGILRRNVNVISKITHPAPPPGDVQVRKMQRVKDGRRLAGLQLPRQPRRPAVVRVEQVNRAVGLLPVPQDRLALQEAAEAALERDLDVVEAALDELIVPRAAIAGHHDSPAVSTGLEANIDDVAAQAARVAGKSEVKNRRLVRHLHPDYRTPPQHRNMTSNRAQCRRWHAMKVLHAISGIRRSQGGPTFALEGLARAQKAIGLGVTVVATYIVEEGRDAAKHFQEMGVDCHVYGPAHGKFSRLAGLNEIMARHVAEADVVHIHAMWEEIQHVAAVEARRAEKPYVWRACNAISWPIMQKSYWLKRGVLAWRLKKDLNLAAAMHYTTETEASESKWLGLISPSVVEPNGVDLAASPGSAERFLARYPQLRGRRVLLFVGRLNPEKGFEILIPAFAQAQQEDVTLVIVGSDPDRPYRAVIESMIRQHGLSADRVLLTGHLEGAEKQDAYAAADCFVLPSRSENFGNVVVEALGQGLPVIVTRGVGLAGEVEAAGVGRVVEYDVNSLREAIVGAFAVPGRLRRSDNARKFLAGRFDWLAIARRWEDHYRKAIGGAVIGR